MEYLQCVVYLLVIITLSIGLNNIRKIIKNNKAINEIVKQIEEINK